MIYSVSYVTAYLTVSFAFQFSECFGRKSVFLPLVSLFPNSVLMLTVTFRVRVVLFVVSVHTGLTSGILPSTLVAKIVKRFSLLTLRTSLHVISISYKLVPHAGVEPACHRYGFYKI